VTKREKEGDNDNDDGGGGGGGGGKKDKGEKDEKIEVARMGAGRYFGEIALVTNEPRTATVVTVNRCAMLSITKENFQIFFEEAPEALADFEIKLARYQVGSIAHFASILITHFKLHFFVSYLIS
jgi:CRP-like cAMP-binding protein